MAYWASKELIKTFGKFPSFGNNIPATVGAFTCDNERFLRCWHEVSVSEVGFKCHSHIEAEESGKKFFPYNKGGGHRRWYGLREMVVNFYNDGQEIRERRVASGQSYSLPGYDYYFQKGITWSDITTSSFGARYTPQGAIFDIKGASAFPPDTQVEFLISVMCSRLFVEFMSLINPTSTFQVGDIKRIPLPFCKGEVLEEIKKKAKKAIEISKKDWDELETSFDFKGVVFDGLKIGESINEKVDEKRRLCCEVFSLESDLEELVSFSYGLRRKEILQEMKISDITLFSNFYNDESAFQEKSAVSQEVLRFISYSIGCMMGRYSLDKPGLILASQGETGSFQPSCPSRCR